MEGPLNQEERAAISAGAAASRAIMVLLVVAALLFNIAAPAAEMVKAPEALPPLFTRANARSGLPPIDTKPYAYCDRSNASTAGPAPADATPAGTPTSPINPATTTTARPKPPRTATPLNQASPEYTAGHAKPVTKPGPTSGTGSVAHSPKQPRQ